MFPSKFAQPSLSASDTPVGIDSGTDVTTIFQRAVEFVNDPFSHASWYVTQAKKSRLSRTSKERSNAKLCEAAVDQQLELNQVFRQNQWSLSTRYQQILCLFWFIINVRCGTHHRPEKKAAVIFSMPDVPGSLLSILELLETHPRRRCTLYMFSTHAIKRQKRQQYHEEDRRPVYLSRSEHGLGVSGGVLVGDEGSVLPRVEYEKLNRLAPPFDQRKKKKSYSSNVTTKHDENTTIYCIYSYILG